MGYLLIRNVMDTTNSFSGAAFDRDQVAKKKLLG
jgi:hypothetical protein